jgi:hypothetical protein
MEAGRGVEDQEEVGAVRSELHGKHGDDPRRVRQR